MKLFKFKKPCEHQWVLRVDDTVWKEKVYKCAKCGKVVSKFY